MKSLLSLAFIFLSLGSFAQQPYWQQQVDYVLDVALNEQEKAIDGAAKISYTNNSPDTLHFIWFHIWPNAYKNDRTAFSDQLLELGTTDFYFSNKEKRGYINRLDFRVDGRSLKTEDHPNYIDVIKLLLPEPLLPGKQIQLTTPFHVKLPYNFSRGGFDKKTFQLTQWYPKPAVYDAQGWHPMPYLDQGEFYSEFGNYDVRLTLPKDYVVAATGELQNDEEKEWLRMKSVSATQEKKPQAASKKPAPSKPVSKGKPGKKPATKTATVAKPKPVVADIVEMKTLRFVQNNVHDFALFVNKDFIVKTDTCQLPGGNVIKAAVYYTKEEESTWKNSLAFTKYAIRFYSKEVGAYPYPVVSVVQGPKSFGGGMEYPTITLISPMPDEKSLDLTIAHEVGHNWFYGILASNERAHPWMDEGINSFYENKYSEAKYGRGAQGEELLFLTQVKKKRDQPIETTSEVFTKGNYGLVAYHKTARWMDLLEEKMGKEPFQKAMQSYYGQWKFKHSQPADFKNSMAPFIGTDTADLFALLTTTGALPNQKLSGFKIVSPLQPKSIGAYFKNPSKNVLLLSPSVGINKYDGLMIGGLVSNFALPPSSFQFLVSPKYATASKKLAGLAHLSYAIYPDKGFQKIEASLSGLAFSKNKNLDSNNNKVFERFYKLTPALRFSLRSPLKSTKDNWIEARSYFIREDEFSKFVTKSSNNLNYVDSNSLQDRYLNQLTLNLADHRKLYPYDAQVQLQQGKGFYRANFTGNYYFNYANGGGANVRLFAAKFGTLGNKKENDFSTFLYQPKLLGVTGEEDYTYSNYFYGRTASFANDNSVVENAGLAAQQIMIRDGGMKLRIDQYEFLQGRSDNWVAALNLNTSLPPNLFPVKLPLKLFLDIGTSANAWKEEAPTSKILYVGGLQASFIKDIVQVYLPLIYSSDFRTYLKTLPDQNKLLKKLTFSIDLQRVGQKRILENLFSF